MELIEGVFELAEQFMEKPKYLKINEEETKKVAEQMLNTGIKKFPYESDGTDAFEICWKELIASSINYCFFYGRSDVRPKGSSSSVMYEIVNEAFDMSVHKLDEEFEPLFFFRKGAYSWKEMQYGLAYNRLPLLEERLHHLKEVQENGAIYIKHLVASKGEDFYQFFHDLVLLFPGFASDQFLKRASLFFLQLNRHLGWFEDAVKVLPVPADYQVPNMMRHFGCIDYSQQLYQKIWRGDLIPKHSRMECEIRAATIITARMIQELTGWSVADVDGWFWLRRKETTLPFHLTITTDY